MQVGYTMGLKIYPWGGGEGAMGAGKGGRQRNSVSDVVLWRRCFQSYASYNERPEKRARRALGCQIETGIGDIIHGSR